MLIAITGGIAEGKSTVLKMLSEAGWRTASADDLAREVFRNDSVQQAIAEMVGLPLPIDRATLRARLAIDPAVRRSLNRLMHPLITRQIKAGDYQAVEIPLLIESALQAEAREVWVVTCGIEEQERRLIERLGSSAQAKDLLSTQLPTRAKIPFAHRVIRTNRPMEAVHVNVLDGIAALPFA